MARRTVRMCEWLPYKSHPIFRLRIVTSLTITVGLISSGISMIDLFTRSDTWSFLIISDVFLFFSFIFIFHDLMTYAISVLSTRRSTSEPISDDLPYSDASTTWPSKRLIISDLIFAIIFQWLSWIGWAVIASSNSYYSGSSDMFAAYANLALFAASIEHGVAFWKELIARKKAAWMRDLDARPCRNCGHVEHPVPGVLDVQIPQPEANPSGSFGTRLRPSSRTSIRDCLSSSKVTLPAWATSRKASVYHDEEEAIGEVVAKDDVEEPLLVTPDDSTTEVGEPSRVRGYGTLSQSVESIEAIPETLVKKKDKGKKRLVEVE